VGDILSITPSEIATLTLVFIGVILLWVFIFNNILLLSINQSLAASRGINTFVTEIFFTAAIAVVVTITIQWVGLLIINSLLVLPAAAARNISSNARQYTLFSVGISFFSGIMGLILSYYLGTATGATIVLVSAVVFFSTFALRRKFAT
jgi:zinc transport system permease protein